MAIFRNERAECQCIDDATNNRALFNIEGLLATTRLKEEYDRFVLRRSFTLHSGGIIMFQKPIHSRCRWHDSWANRRGLSQFSGI